MQAMLPQCPSSPSANYACSCSWDGSAGLWSIGFSASTKGPLSFRPSALTFQEDVPGPSLLCLHGCFCPYPPPMPCSPVLDRSIWWWNAIAHGHLSFSVSWSHVFFIWVFSVPIKWHIFGYDQVFAAKMSVINKARSSTASVSNTGLIIVLWKTCTNQMKSEYHEVHMYKKHNEITPEEGVDPASSKQAS